MAIRRGGARPALATQMLIFGAAHRGRGEPRPYEGRRRGRPEQIPLYSIVPHRPAVEPREPTRPRLSPGPVSARGARRCTSTNRHVPLSPHAAAAVVRHSANHVPQCFTRGRRTPTKRYENPCSHAPRRATSGEACSTTFHTRAARPTKRNETPSRPPPARRSARLSARLSAASFRPPVRQIFNPLRHSGIGVPQGGAVQPMKSSGTGAAGAAVLLRRARRAA